MSTADNPGAVQVGTRIPGHELYAIETSPTQIPIREKVRLLEEIDQAARAVDPRIKMVIASFAAEDKVVMVVNSDGRIGADRQPLCRLNVTVIAEDGGNRQTGSFGGGGRVEWGFFLEDERWRQYAQEAARQALINLEAIDAPAGEMVVVLGPGWPGVLLHEAVGHGSGRRLQSQKDLDLQRPYRPAGCQRTVHRGGRRHYPKPPRQSQY